MLLITTECKITMEGVKCVRNLLLACNTYNTTAHAGNINVNETF